MTAADPLDLIIIGGGLGGVVCLHYARQAGLKTMLGCMISTAGAILTFVFIEHPFLQLRAFLLDRDSEIVAETGTPLTV